MTIEAHSGSASGDDRPGRAARGLSPEQREAFVRRGYVSGLDVLTPDEARELRARVEAIGDDLRALEPELYEVERAWLERPGEVVLHFLGAWRVDARFRELVFDPRVATPVADALGCDRLRFWHDQVFWKPARHRGVVPWHQDYAYWTRTGPPGHATLFLALDDMDATNGALEIVPGSHRWGLLPAQDFGGPRDALLEHLTDEQRRAFRPERVELRAGQASIHDAHAIHGSGPNAADRPRRAVVLNYMVDGTRVVDGAQPLLRGVPRIAEGEVVDGPDFPIVLDRTRADQDPRGGSPARS